MTAAISEVMKNGKLVAEAAFANKPAWHGLGQIFDAGGNKGMTSKQAIELSNAGWKVEKEDVFLNDGSKIEGFMGLVRQDTKKTLAMVGKKYQPLQNTEAFDFLDSLMMDDIMRYESAIVLQGGERVCLLARMPSIDWVVPQSDCLERFILFSMSHGYGGIDILPTAVRVVCQNTQRLALEEGKMVKWSIRHSGDLQAKLNMARKYISQFDKRFTDYCEDAKKLLVGYTEQQRKDYLAELFPAPADTDGKRKQGNYQVKMDNLAKALVNDAQTVRGVKGTWWSLFNAVTECVDHSRPARQSKDERTRLENRFMSVTNGPDASFKDLALTTALKMAL